MSDTDLFFLVNLVSHLDKMLYILIKKQTLFSRSVQGSLPIIDMDEQGLNYRDTGDVGDVLILYILQYIPI